MNLCEKHVEKYKKKPAKKIVRYGVDPGQAIAPMTIHMVGECIKYLRTGDVNQIGLVSLQQGGSLHFGKINGQGDVLVQWPSESLRVVNLVAQKVFGKFGFGNIVLDCQDLDIVASLFQILEHFFESVGISRDVCERRGFHHQGDLSRRIARQRRSIIRGLPKFGGASARSRNK